MQEQFLQQQRAFEDRMNTLIRSNSAQPLPDPASELLHEKSRRPDDTAPSATEFVSLPRSIDHTQADPTSNIGEAFSPEPKQPYTARQPAFPYSYPYQGPVVGQMSKVRATDLPKFKGADDEDIELWIQQLSAIFEANRVSDAEILDHISITLKDNASLWYVKLGSDVRSSLATCDSWKHALPQRFQKANNNTDKRRAWKQRKLEVEEKMSTYYDE